MHDMFIGVISFINQMLINRCFSSHVIVVEIHFLLTVFPKLVINTSSFCFYSVD